MLSRICLTDEPPEWLMSSYSFERFLYINPMKICNVTDHAIRSGKTDISGIREFMSIYTYIDIHMYVYIYIHIYVSLSSV